MFFRLKKTKSGEVLKLLESYREGASQPKHRTVASLGSAPLAQESWKAVAKSVEDHLYGRRELIGRDLSDQERHWVDHIVRKVESEGRWKSRSQGAEGAVLDGVLAEKVTHEATAELGTVLIGWQAWNELGLSDLLGTLGFNRAQIDAAAITVLNRLVDPVSDHSLLDWYRRTGLPELMGNRLRGAGDDRFYRVSDKLLSRQSAIEEHLREREAHLWDLQRVVLLYDLTNSHFEGVCKGNPKAKRGVNKQKRNDCPQVVVGMIFDQFGFELAHRVFEGSMHDGKSLMEMVHHFDAIRGDPEAKPVIVLDGGIATKGNLKRLREEGYSYLVNDSRRMRGAYREYFAQDELFREVQGRPGKPPVRVRLMDDPCDEKGIGEKIVLCKSESRGAKEEAILSNAEKRFLADLEKLVRRVQHGKLKEADKIQNAIGRLQSRHPRVQRFYTITRSEHAKGPAIEWTRDDQTMQENAVLFGAYVLRTMEDALDEQQLWQLYMSLSRAEEGFRALKSDLGLRPNRHQKEFRVDGHVLICVLAYHLLRHILYKLEQQNDHRSWDTIKRIMRTHCYTTVILPTQSGTVHRLRRPGQPDEVQKDIYRKLNIDWKGLPKDAASATL